MQDRRERFLKGLYADSDLLALDPNAKIDEYRQNSMKDKFLISMENKDIEVLGEFIGNHLGIKLRCKDCKHEWTNTPAKAISLNCPGCNDVQNNVKADKRLFQRSLAIVRDKRGKVVKYSDFDPLIKCSVDDKFIIVCHREHRFTTSHRYLRRDRWCPVCEKTLLHKDNLSSNAVYGKKGHDQNRQKAFLEICKAKGVNLLSMKRADGKYKLSCKSCGTKFKKNEHQILNNIFLCPSECVRGEKLSFKTMGY